MRNLSEQVVVSSSQRDCVNTRCQEIVEYTKHIHSEVFSPATLSTDIESGLIDRNEEFHSVINRWELLSEHERTQYQAEEILAPFKTTFTIVDTDTAKLTKLTSSGASSLEVLSQLHLPKVILRSTMATGNGHPYKRWVADNTHTLFPGNCEPNQIIKRVFQAYTLLAGCNVRTNIGVHTMEGYLVHGVPLGKEVHKINQIAENIVERTDENGEAEDALWVSPTFFERLDKKYKPLFALHEETGFYAYTGPVGLGSVSYDDFDLGVTYPHSLNEDAMASIKRHTHGISRHDGMSEHEYLESTYKKEGHVLFLNRLTTEPETKKEILDNALKNRKFSQLTRQLAAQYCVNFVKGQEHITIVEGDDFEKVYACGQHLRAIANGQGMDIAGGHVYGTYHLYPRADGSFEGSGEAFCKASKLSEDGYIKNEILVDESASTAGRAEQSLRTLSSRTAHIQESKMKFSVQRT